MPEEQMKRMVIDIQVPPEFELSPDARLDIVNKGREFARDIADQYSKKNEGGIVQSNIDTLTDQHTVIVAVGFKPAGKAQGGDAPAPTPADAKTTESEVKS